MNLTQFLKNDEIVSAPSVLVLAENVEATLNKLNIKFQKSFLLDFYRVDYYLNDLSIALEIAGPHHFVKP